MMGSMSLGLSVLSYYKTGLTSGKWKASAEKYAACSPAPLDFATKTSSNGVSTLSMKPSSNLSAKTTLPR